MNSRIRSSLVMLALVASAQAAIGAFINAPVPTNAFITKGGLDWAWANPVPADPDGGWGVTFDLSYQAAFGWRIPTANDLAFAPLATDFLVSWGNVPFDGVDPVSGAHFEATNSAYDSAESAGAVAVPYFSLEFRHADFQDGLGQNQVWAGMDGAPSFADQLVVRSSVVGAPETGSTLGLFGLMFVVLATLRRRFGS